MASRADQQQIDSIRAFYERAKQAMKSGDLKEAESLCARAQVIYPHDLNLQCLLGEILLKRGRPQVALTWFSRVLTHSANYPRALEGSGKALLADGRARKAVKMLQRAVEAAPTRSATHLALCRALAAAGEGEAADVAMRRALELNPDKAAVSRAAEALAEERLADAEKIVRAQLATRPDDPLALRLLAQIALESNHRRAALRLLKRTLEVAPDFILAWNDLAELHMKEEDYPEALEAAEQAITLDRRLPHSWAIKGNILTRAQRHEEALAAYATALEISPWHAGALSGKGHVLKTIGRTEEGIASYRECIRHHPGFGEAYWSLANLKTFSFEPAELEAMTQAVDDDSTAEDPRSAMLYSLGKHYENQGAYDQAFGYYQRGAALRRGREVYDPVQNQVIHDRLIATFTPELMARMSGWGDPDPAPILIVGLPRSGSTLIEQILASHSQVEGTLELPDLNRRIRDVTRARKDGVEYPEAVADLKQEDVSALGRRYLETTQRFRSGKPHFIDKMPNNFSHLGFLHLILPGARVIDARRHPLDSCLGSFKQLFFKGQSFSYDLFELGQYYLQYRRIMDHWHALLPGAILEVNYEDLVRGQEGETHRMLEFCGLPFEEQCLRFWETERAINTASSEQVRQPIYTSGLNFWRHYERHLGELIEQLEPLLLELPEEDRPEELKSVIRDS